ncbi:MAG: substrate-binding domain-containing protein [Oscillospiraceae bacterium]
MKNTVRIVLSAVMIMSLFAGCKNNDNATPADAFDAQNDITVISREDGSGTRGAFTEIFDIIEKDTNGNKVDITTETADITQSTGVMLTSTQNNPYAIGYISLGSLNDSVKAVKIDGVDATTENIKNGTYKASRPFNIATMGNESQQTADFINFIMSDDGQKVVTDAGYISKESTGAFSGTKPQGKITVSGSSSVTPAMEKLKEAYEKINPNAVIEINQSDSTNGMNAVAEGVCDIGMASRELKDSETEKGIQPKVIALDGIAVVVNNQNTTENLSSEQVKGIYTGEATTWAEVI